MEDEMADVDLFALEFDEVSLVPSGDNPPAYIVMSKVAPELLRLSKGTSSGTLPKGVKAHAFTAKDSDADTCATCGGTQKQCKAMFGKDAPAQTIEMPDLDDLNDAIDAWDSMDIDNRQQARDMLLAVAQRIDAPADVVASIQALPVSKASGSNTPTTRKGGTVELTDEQKTFIAGLPEDQREVATTLMAGAADDTGGDTGGKTGDEGGKPTTTTTVTTDDPDLALALTKADPAVRTVLQKMADDLKTAQETATEATETAEHERSLRVDREMIAKATTLTNLQGSPEEKAAVLKAAYGVSTEVGDAILGQMTAADRQLGEAGAMFTAVGKTAPGQAPATHQQEAETKAQELVKANPTLTIEKALSRVYAEDPGLYDRQMKEAANAG